MLNVSMRHIFWKIHVEDTYINIKVTKKNLLHKFETVITHSSIDNQTLNLVSDFPKPIAVIMMNQIHLALNCRKVIENCISTCLKNIQACVVMTVSNKGCTQNIQGPSWVAAIHELEWEVFHSLLGNFKVGKYNMVVFYSSRP